MNADTDRWIEEYCRGKISESDMTRLLGWIDENPDNLKYFKAQCRCFSPSTHDDRSVKAWHRFRSAHPLRRLQLHRRHTTMIRIGLSAAAVIAVGVMLTRYQHSSQNSGQYVSAPGETAFVDPIASLQTQREYFAAGDSVMKILLDDSTRITLHAGAKLQVDPLFNIANRNVLLDGEAFFDVHPDTELSFVVTSGKATYTVLGTSFNIHSYADDDFAVVTLHTGRLTTRVGDDVIMLEPGNEVLIDTHARTLSKRMVKVANSIGWLEGRIIFDALPLSEVVRKLERKYGVDIRVSDEIAGLEYTGAIDKESIQEVMHLVGETSLVALDIKTEQGKYLITKKKNK